MSLPIVIVFERHWDVMPKYLIKNLLPDLARRGYNTLALEAPEDLKTCDIRERHNRGIESGSQLFTQATAMLKRAGITQELSGVSFSQLAEWIQLYVSSKDYLKVTEEIKNLPASLILKEIFDETKRLSFSLKGIDIKAVDYDKLTSEPLLTRMAAVAKVDSYRTDTFVYNLLKLKEENEGVVFLCGALHADNLLSKFKRLGLEDDLLCYFPHSSKRFDDSTDDLTLPGMNIALEGRRHLLSTPAETLSLKDRIIVEVTLKIRYSREITERNSHAEFLRDFFGTHFKAYLRPGYHVDALLDVDEVSISEPIQKQLQATGISTHYSALYGRNLLVIPSINTKDVAESIRRLRH